MKTKLLLLTFLLPTIMFAQVGNGFENTPGVTFNASGGSCQYFDFDTTTIHTLANYNAPCGLIYVTEPSSGATLGYSIILDPTSPNGPSGFGDGDFFGVGTSAFFNTEIALSPPEGSQGFFMEDPDGDITMTFDIVDLAGTTNPQFSMQYVLEATSWEAEDFLRVTIQFTDCASPTLTLIDTLGLDIDDLGIEDTWNTLNADLTAYAGCKAQLVIEFSSNSAAEELGLDAISFTAGMTLSTPSLDLENSISIVPNPSQGIVTIKNSGIALHTAVITDINGRAIKTYDLNGSALDKTLDLTSEVSSGLYFMTISSENGSVVKKIIIE
ncbi:T9SS type A sorting domain-containing protein [Psychroserpens sp. SPM9]|uniref:T9SS type A sorting domain-containing protein n=1 Tax=Psychroserpens sp. SPM9 TaxID=2975598 RepID=UPI0021A96060|nr:T9SS type A sorting domain-containing protein [Psychroserpens sp. SPM9]MDG5490385.1 T9SS type A sorting domain-containing protein [Psychroserpens sp. SPM9]